MLILYFYTYIYIVISTSFVCYVIVSNSNIWNFFGKIFNSGLDYFTTTWLFWGWPYLWSHTYIMFVHIWYVWKEKNHGYAMVSIRHIWGFTISVPSSPLDKPYMLHKKKRRKRKKLGKTKVNGFVWYNYTERNITTKVAVCATCMQLPVLYPTYFEDFQCQSGVNHIYGSL